MAEQVMEELAADLERTYDLCQRGDRPPRGQGRDW